MPLRWSWATKLFVLVALPLFLLITAGIVGLGEPLAKGIYISEVNAGFSRPSAKCSILMAGRDFSFMWIVSEWVSQPLL